MREGGVQKTYVFIPGTIHVPVIATVLGFFLFSCFMFRVALHIRNTIPNLLQDKFAATTGLLTGSL